MTTKTNVEEIIEAVLLADAVLVRTDGTVRPLNSKEHSALYGPADKALEILRELIDCEWVQFVPDLRHRLEFWIDEEGKHNGSEFNANASDVWGYRIDHNDPIMGNAVICKPGVIQ